MPGKDKGFVMETDGGNVEVDIDHVKSLADSGNPDGFYALGMAHLFGWDIEQDVQKGFRLLEKASDAGHADAMTLLVSMFMSGDYHNMDSKKAVEYSKIGADAGIS
ncbi:MAG: hypothetical protein LBV63_04105, partial [Candidatus Methanoplasma sp.]|nr:hypothetical protein [Candidatus Methanoplasma sp.]